MALKRYTNASWVETDGSYGTSDIILFDYDDLTEAQHDTLSNLSDRDRLDYVQAIMSGEPLHEWEECEHPHLKHAEGDATMAFCPDCDLEFPCMCEECVF